MLDDSETELKIAHTSFAEPYLLVIRSDSSAVVLRAEDNGELEEIDSGDAFRAAKWATGSLHKPRNGTVTYAYLLSTDSNLQAC